MKNRRVLVTGGAGFIGSNLAEELTGENEVVILDDLSTGRMGNIKELIKNDNVEFIRGTADISKANSFGYEPTYSLEDGLRETISHF